MDQNLKIRFYELLIISVIVLTLILQIKAQSQTQPDISSMAVITLTSHASSPSAGSKSEEPLVSLDGLKPLIITASCVAGIVVITLVVCIIRRVVNKRRRHKSDSNYYDDSHNGDGKGYTNYNSVERTIIMVIIKEEEEKEVSKVASETDIILKVQSDNDSSDHK
ncbi:22544_t:CDS:2 [Cetraspora pellucida]|uniref:22544_t:CDS:1 n=1 Tax=Cetraspora pellucida TaxID=1433469 RepID=A0A9N8ZNU4_9GLOM|nr:22544_t:CDS:2 [Cetraspora pellucida]